MLKALDIQERGNRSFSGLTGNTQKLLQFQRISVPCLDFIYLFIYRYLFIYLFVYLFMTFITLIGVAFLFLCSGNGLICTGYVN